jgi:serine/threonine-protein kinase
VSLELSPDHAGDCPSRDALLAYALGKLPGASLESVAEHVTQCPRCNSTLNQLQTQEDTLVRNLRRFVPVDASAGLTAQDSKSQDATVDYSRPVSPLPATTLSLPCRLGRYELLKELGRGGMGVVYLARQIGLNRLVALKLAFGGVPVEIEALARFRTESQAIARLQHEHIVRIYDYGEEDDRPFFAMELLEGGSLAQKLAGQMMPLRDAAVLVHNLALAVQYAHQNKVLHRDLKPANVLLGTSGEVKLSDFGLAKLLDVDGGQTQSGAVLGTPSYMAPEQARGETKTVGPRTDVYGLGAILYEALTGQPPFKTGSQEQTLEQVQTQSPLPPSRLRPELSADLEAICLKCLEKMPEDRYASAEALVADLDRWLRGLPIRRLRWEERIRRFLWRHRAACLIAVVCGLAVVGTSLLAGYTHPDRPLWEIESDLKQGKRVVLIGESGGPRWSRWRAQSNDKQAPGTHSGTFTIRSFDTGLLELVPDPKYTAYRFSAEVRHEECSPGYGFVGLFVAGEQPGGPGSKVHQFIHLCFNDILPQTPPPGIKLRAPRIIPVVTKMPVDLRPVALQLKLPLNDQQFFPGSSDLLCDTAGFGHTTWRKLVVEVRPGEFRGTWEGQPVSPPLSTQRITDGVKKYLAFRRKSNSDDLIANQVQSRFSTHGGLGLYVCRGSASFRFVVLEPLVEDFVHGPHPPIAALAQSQGSLVDRPFP